MTTVKEVMVSNVTAVKPSTPVIEVARQMNVSRQGAIPVCDNGRFRGVITERDIVIGIVAIARDPIREPASSVMSRGWPIVSPEEDVIRAATIMVDNGARMLPVVQNGKLLGLFSLGNLARESLGIAALVFAKTFQTSNSQRDEGQAKLTSY